MTLEDISVLFGDPVELSFEQALSKQEHREADDVDEVMMQEKQEGRQVENIPLEK